MKEKIIKYCNDNEILVNLNLDSIINVNEDYKDYLISEIYN